MNLEEVLRGPTIKKGVSLPRRSHSAYQHHRRVFLDLQARHEGHLPALRTPSLEPLPCRIRFSVQQSCSPWRERPRARRQAADWRGRQAAHLSNDFSLRSRGAIGGNVAKKPKPKPDDEEQSRRFVETARELVADESGKAFDRAISSITSSKSKKDKRRPG